MKAMMDAVGMRMMAQIIIVEKTDVENMIVKGADAID